MALRLPTPAPDLPRAQQDPGRGHRPARRVARRRAGGQGLHRGAARRSGSSRGGVDKLFAQHPQHDDRHLGGDHRLDRAPRRRRRDHDGGRRARDPRRLDDARRFRHVRLLHRPAGGAGGARSPSIGTQLTEAFAGLDRIREIFGRGDRGRGGRGARAGRDAARRRRVRGRLVRVRAGHAGAARRLVPRRRPARRPRSSARPAPARAR